MGIRVLINGANGKMGQMTVKTFSAISDFSIVACTHRKHDLINEIKKNNAEVVIDFTNANSVLENINAIIDAGARPVIGTSGLLPAQVSVLQKKCKEIKLGGLIAPNFSIGAILMMKYAKEIIKYFPQVEIIEMHHADKLDSPSGTAIRTAEILASARLTKCNKSLNTRETIPGARGASYENIPIHSIRLPGLLASQQIIFGSMGETLTLRQDTLDRQAFMQGAILACKKVMELTELIYGLENILSE